MINTSGGIHALGLQNSLKIKLWVGSYSSSLPSFFAIRKISDPYAVRLNSDFCAEAMYAETAMTAKDWRFRRFAFVALLVFLRRFLWASAERSRASIAVTVALYFRTFLAKCSVRCGKTFFASRGATEAGSASSSSLEEDRSEQSHVKSIVPRCKRKEGVCPSHKVDNGYLVQFHLERTVGAHADLNVVVDNNSVRPSGWLWNSEPTSPAFGLFFGRVFETGRAMAMVDVLPAEENQSSTGLPRFDSLGCRAAIVLESGNDVDFNIMEPETPQAF